MLSSKKILYLIISALVLVCGINGIDYRSGAYADNDIITDEIITFSDSAFFDVPDAAYSVPTLTGDGANSADVYIPEDTTTTADTPDIVTLSSDTGETTTTLPSDEPAGTTSNTAAPATTTTTMSTTTTTTTTTTTAPTTTTTTRVYYDTGSLHFTYSTIRIYAGSSVAVELSFPFGAQRLASFSSKNTTIASASAYNDTTALITGVSLGTTWVQATSSSGDIAYCKVIVTDFAEEVIRLTNIERANYGLSTLTQAGQLVQTVANIRLNESMLYFAHDRPNGQKFSTAALDVGLQYSKIGENLASGQTTPEQVVAEWMESPSHRANILDSAYTQMSVSYGIGPDGKYYWVQIFYAPPAASVQVN